MLGRFAPGISRASGPVPVTAGVGKYTFLAPTIFVVS